MPRARAEHSRDERWLAPILNYNPAQDQSASDRALKQAMAAPGPAAAVPANDIAGKELARKELASHPPGCACAVHLAWRKTAVGAG